MSAELHTVRIDRLDHIICDGTKIAFRMHTADQWHKDVHLSAADAGKFVALILSTLVRDMPALPAGQPTTLTAVPIPAKAIGHGNAPDGTPLVAVNLGLMQLVFSLPATLPPTA
jgi:hypothetical protein